MTVGGTTNETSLAFDRNAIVLATRLPFLPDGGDEARARTTVIDTFTGLAFEVAEYRQYRQVKYEISIAWGVGMVKPEHVIALVG